MFHCNSSRVLSGRAGLIQSQPVPWTQHGPLGRFLPRLHNTRDLGSGCPITKAAGGTKDGHYTAQGQPRLPAAAAVGSSECTLQISSGNIYVRKAEERYCVPGTSLAALLSKGVEGGELPKTLQHFKLSNDGEHYYVRGQESSLCKMINNLLDRVTDLRDSSRAKAATSQDMSSQSDMVQEEEELLYIMSLLALSLYHQFYRTLPTRASSNLGLGVGWTFTEFHSQIPALQSVSVIMMKMDIWGTVELDTGKDVRKLHILELVACVSDMITECAKLAWPKGDNGCFMDRNLLWMTAKPECIQALCDCCLLATTDEHQPKGMDEVAWTPLPHPKKTLRQLGNLQEARRVAMQLHAAALECFLPRPAPLMQWERDSNATGSWQACYLAPPLEENTGACIELSYEHDTDTYVGFMHRGRVYGDWRPPFMMSSVWGMICKAGWKAFREGYILDKAATVLQVPAIRDWTVRLCLTRDRAGNLYMYTADQPQARLMFAMAAPRTQVHVVFGYNAGSIRQHAAQVKHAGKLW